MLESLEKSAELSELDVGKAAEPKEISKFHILTKNEQDPLDINIGGFSSYAKEGLGRTSLISHSIKVGSAAPVKQWHWPVSPAIEKLMKLTKC